MGRCLRLPLRARPRARARQATGSENPALPTPHGRSVCGMRYLHGSIGRSPRPPARTIQGARRRINGRKSGAFRAARLGRREESSGSRRQADRRGGRRGSPTGPRTQSKTAGEPAAQAAPSRTARVRRGQGAGGELAALLALDPGADRGRHRVDVRRPAQDRRRLCARAGRGRRRRAPRRGSAAARRGTRRSSPGRSSRAVPRGRSCMGRKSRSADRMSATVSSWAR